MPVAADYPLLDVFWTMILFFAWMTWFWMLITVFMDVFRRRDISGWGKAAWCFFMLILPFLGVLIYLIAEGKEMSERRAAEMVNSKAAFDDYVRTVAADSGPTDQIAKAKELLDAGTIDASEFEQIKRKALAAT